MAALSMSKLNKYMQNQSQGHFDFEVFKAAYDQDDRLQEIVTNFDDKKIELKQHDTDELSVGSDDMGDSKVAAMANRATNLDDTL